MCSGTDTSGALFTSQIKHRANSFICSNSCPPQLAKSSNVHSEKVIQPKTKEAKITIIGRWANAFQFIQQPVDPPAPAGRTMIFSLDSSAPAAHYFFLQTQSSSCCMWSRLYQHKQVPIPLNAPTTITRELYSGHFGFISTVKYTLTRLNLMVVTALNQPRTNFCSVHVL